MFITPYLEVHKRKDKPYEYMGKLHRHKNHDWYWLYGDSWDFSNPFPEWKKESIRKFVKLYGVKKAEEHMAEIDHDFIDKKMDYHSLEEKKKFIDFLIWLLFNHKVLKYWAGVDVLNGKIKRIVNNNKIWEDCPELIKEYKGLCNYIRKWKKLHLTDTQGVMPK